MLTWKSIRERWIKKPAAEPSVPHSEPVLALPLAHTARMLWTIDQRPGHPRLPEYDRQFKIYSGKWAAASDAERDEALVYCQYIPDLTPELINAAVQKLEA